MIGGEVRADPGSAAARTHTRPNLRLELRAPLVPLYDPRMVLRWAPALLTVLAPGQVAR